MRQGRLERLGKGFLVAGASIEHENALLARFVDRASTFHALDRVPRGIDFTKLDALTQMLDLVILTTAIHESSCLVEHGHVTRAVHRLGKCLRVGILHEDFGGLLGIIVVTERQAGADNAKLTLDTGLVNELIIVVKKEDAFVGEGPPHGNDLVLRVVAHDDVVGTVAGYLGGAVHVHEHGIGQRLAPHGKLLGRHDLAAEDDRANRRGHAILEATHHGDEAHRAHGPGANGDIALDKEVHEVHGDAKVLARDHLHGRARGETAVDILDRHIEVEGRLVS